MNHMARRSNNTMARRDWLNCWLILASDCLLAAALVGLTATSILVKAPDPVVLALVASLDTFVASDRRCSRWRREPRNPRVRR
jgi:hypothetical protein